MTSVLAAEVIGAQFPELAPAEVAYLNEGCDSVAFDVNGAWVFRFPKRADVERQLLVEIRVLSILASGAPVAIPRFRFHGQPCPAFPYHFVGYPRIPGVSAIQLEPARVPFGALAPVLARFLGWLHAFPIADVEPLGVERHDLGALLEETRIEALDDFHLVGTVAPNAPLDEWQTYLQAGPGAVFKSSSPSVLLHNDLAAEHILLDPDTHRITGILDWSDMAIGHRLVDFAGVFHWGGEPFVKEVLSTYGGSLDRSLLPCARFLAACRGVGDVAFGLETGRRVYIDAGLRALDLCATNAEAKRG